MPPEMDRCGVCLDDMDDRVFESSCSHAFHAECTLKMLLANITTCPLCRAPLVHQKPEPTAIDVHTAVGMCINIDLDILFLFEFVCVVITLIYRIMMNT